MADTLPWTPSGLRARFDAASTPVQLLVVIAVIAFLIEVRLLPTPVLWRREGALPLRHLGSR